MLRGNYAAKIDDKGRLKIPNAFRAVIQAQHGTELFVTSLTGSRSRSTRCRSGWRSKRSWPRCPPRIRPGCKYLDRVNYFGQVAEFDSQGRVVIHPRLRDAAGMAGEVDVFGQYDVLEVWNHERFVAKLQQEALHGRRRAGARGVRDLTPWLHRRTSR